MESQPEITTALVCGTAISVAAEELELAGVEVKDRAAFTALSQVVNLHKITLSKMTFADAGWDGLLAGIKAGTRLTHLWTTRGLPPRPPSIAKPPQIMKHRRRWQPESLSQAYI